MGTLLGVYGLAAASIVLPVLRSPDRYVVGAERSDLWDSLWSFWYVQRVLWHGEPLLQNHLLNFPQGGRLLVTDLVNGFIVAPLIPVVGLPLAWNLLVFGHLVLAGVAAHLLAVAIIAPPGRQKPRYAGWIAGIGYQASPLLISAIHNGTSEAMGAGWLPLALLATLLASRRGGFWRCALAAGALAICAVASWYGAVCGFLGVGILALVGDGTVPFRRRLVRTGTVLVLALLVVVPFAVLAQQEATSSDNLVGIKGIGELAQLRRGSGAVDPRVWFIPGDFRSPDFRRISRYGEDFIHCSYLGWTLLLGAATAFRGRVARRELAWLGIASLTGAIFALGPVLVRDGQPLIFHKDLAVPLPFFLVERLPGFNSLSLVFRFMELPALGLAVLADVGFCGLTQRAWLRPLLAVLVFAELRLVSPVHCLPAASDATPDPSLAALREADKGAVVNFPVVGGRRYLYEQTIHHQPVAGTLNFPNNGEAKALWSVILENVTEAGRDPAAFRSRVAHTACRRNVRYLVIHDDPVARPDMHDLGAAAVTSSYRPLAWSGTMRIYDLCWGRGI
jgi:hypothetical protein